MPFTRSDASELQKRLQTRGRVIFADGDNGSDATGDGSSAAPWGTLETAAQDLRSAKSDVLVLTGTFAPAQQVVLDGLSSFSVLGLGATVNAQTAGGGTAPLSISDITRVNNRLTEIEFSASHGLSVGDAILLTGISQSGDNLLNGYKGVEAVVNATTIRVSKSFGTPNLNAADEPFASGLTTGFGWVPPMALRGCTEAIVDGISFSEANFGSAVSGLVVYENVADVQSVVRNVRVSNCVFTRGPLGIGPAAVAPGIIGAGLGLVVERCIFAPTDTFSTTWVSEGVGALEIDGGVEVRVLGNLFGYTTLAGATTWAPLGAVRHTGGSPGGGVLLTNNLFPSFSGDGSIQQDRLFHSDREAQFGDLTRIAARRNFFADIATIQEVAMDDEGFLADSEPQTFVGTDELQTQSELVWRAPVVTSISVPDTMGELVAGGRYDDGVFIDTVNGSSGQQLGVHGTPENPVDNETDARAVADALGIRTYRLLSGTLTLTQAHTDWQFRGSIGPENATVDINGQDVDGSGFEQVGVTGDIGGAPAGTLNGKECVLENITNLKGTWITVLFIGACSHAAGATVRVEKARATEALGVTYDMQSGASTFVASGLLGAWTLQNVDGLFGASLEGADVVISSGSGGLVSLSGIHGAPPVNNSGGGVTLNDDSIGQGQLDAAVSTRAAPGDAMGLVAGAVTSAVVATDAIDADALATDAANEIRDAVVAALNDLSQADVQAALTAQGYTPARAPALDNLDAAVSTRATPAGAADAVWDEALAAHVAAGSAAEAVEVIRKVTANRVLVDGTDTTVTVFEDDGTTPALTFTISADRRERTP